ncbi:MAG: endonuclease [Cyclobacteriaceae bacterium]
MKKLVILLLCLNNSLTSAQSIPENYYSRTTDLSGFQLKQSLHYIIRGHRVLQYSEFRDTILPDLDEDPQNDENLILFYKNNSIPKANFASNNQSDFWNREHTWPTSHGFANAADTAYTDIHNLRPSDASVNSSKSNKDFNDVEHISDNEEGEAPETYTTEDFWEPGDDIKGDVARTLFYMDVRYESSNLDLSLVDSESFSGDPEIGVLFTLLRWHQQDPVDDKEIARHEKAYHYQGNRNPFIDHPEWVESIWGSTMKPNVILDLRSFSENFGTIPFGESKTQSYKINGYNLNADIVVSIEAPFFISSDNENFSGQLILQADDNQEEQSFELYLKFEPPNDGGEAYSAIVNHASSESEIEELEVFGEEGSIEVISIAEARGKSLGEVVSITGVVIDAGNNSENNRVICDGTAGIVVRSFDEGNKSANLVNGDSVRIIGGLSHYNNLLQIEEPPIAIDLIKKNASLPEPTVLTIDQIGEPFESQLVTIESVRFSNSGVFAGGGSSGNFLITDGINNLTFRIGSSEHPLVNYQIPSTDCHITGIIGQFQNDYQISPRSVEDLELLGVIADAAIKNEKFTIYPNPSNGVINIQLSGNGSNLHNKLEVIDVTGNILFTDFSITELYDLSFLKAGLYLVKIQTNQGELVEKLTLR